MIAVDKQVRIGAGAYNKGSGTASCSGEDVVWGSSRYAVIGRPQWFTGDRTEFQWITGDFEVNRKVTFGGTSIFVSVKILTVGHLGDDWHTGSSPICRVGFVVDNRTPGLEIGSDLMDKLLTVFGISLIGVIAYELIVVYHEEWFPDGRQAIVRFLLLSETGPTE